MKLSAPQRDALKLLALGPCETYTVAGGCFYSTAKRDAVGIRPKTSDVLIGKGLATTEKIIKGTLGPSRTMTGREMPAVPHVRGFRLTITDAGRLTAER